MWLSLVEHYVRDVGAAGSNPVIPTTTGTNEVCSGFLQGGIAQLGERLLRM